MYIEVLIFPSTKHRPIAMTYERETEFHGIKGMRFSVPMLTLANVTTNPDNLCYCVEPTNPVRNETYYEIEGCLGAGVINLINCLGDRLKNKPWKDTRIHQW